MSDAIEQGRADQPVYTGVLAELRGGRKRSHWMWFTFPQIAGLGSSAMSRRYAIQNLAEARAYLAHPVLGARLKECIQAVLSVTGHTAAEIFGAPDNLKLQSSVTLFAQASGPDAAFDRVLRKYFEGTADTETLRRLES